MMPACSRWWRQNDRFPLGPVLVLVERFRVLLDLVSRPEEGKSDVSVRVIAGDCRTALQALPDRSVHCILTSPPYYNLRSYLPPGHADKPLELGLETTPDAYVAELVGVFREAKRVLRDDGVLWVVIGDSYAGSWGAQGRGGPPSGSSTLKGNGHTGGGPNIKSLSAVQIAAHPMRVSRTGSIPLGSGLKPKDLIGIPWMLAFALRADGWYLRSDNIWHKPNPMPESVQDRTTRSHEYVFMFSKRGSYFYDAEAIAEPASGRDPGNKTHKHVAAYEEASDERLRTKAGLMNIGPSVTRNKRSVWTIASEPNSLAHFAIMPSALAEICIKAGCPVGGTVLDPFAGVGTTGLVADRLGRDAILIELSETNAAMARDRLEGDAGLFAEVSVR
jgi:DNA modification methylase